MSSKMLLRTSALIIAVATSALVQGCAVTTGTFVPSRSVNANRNMTSRFDVLRSQSMPSATPHRTMTTTHEKGFHDYVYY